MVNWDEDNAARARMAGRECGKSLLPTLEMSDIDRTRQELCSNLIDFLTDRVDAGFLSQQFDTVSMEDRSDFMAGLVAVILT